MSDVRAGIASEFLRVHKSAYGTGAGDVPVYMHEDVVMVWLDGLEMRDRRACRGPQGRRFPQHHQPRLAVLGGALSAASVGLSFARRSGLDRVG